MSVPKIVYPVVQITQPSTKKILLFRRYLVKEEKILLLAKETNNLSDIFIAIKNVVGICCQTKDFDVDKISLFDLEYIYLRLRSASVNNIENFSVTDKEDGKTYDFIIDFDKIEVKFPDEVDKIIKVDDNLTIEMKYPAANVYDDIDFMKGISEEGIFFLVVACVGAVYNKEKLLNMTKEETAQFIDNLDIKTFKKIEKFLMSTPSISHKIEYKNSLGNDRSIQFNSLVDFFLYL